MLEFPKPGEHALIAGQTGSGKSVFAAETARQFSDAPVVILDVKLDPIWKQLPVGEQSIGIVNSTGELSTLLRLPKRKQPDYVLIHPPRQEIADADALDAYVDVFHEKARRSAFVVDEAYSLHRAGKSGQGLTSLLTRGRSRGQSAIICTQRPCWLSRFCLTEARHFYIFRLIDVQDRRRITEVAPYDPDYKLDKHCFFWYKQGEDAGTVFAPIPLRGDDPGFTAADEDLKHKWV